jgi:hypothetical protein
LYEAKANSALSSLVMEVFSAGVLGLGLAWRRQQYMRRPDGIRQVYSEANETLERKRMLRRGL